MRPARLYTRSPALEAPRPADGRRGRRVSPVCTSHRACRLLQRRHPAYSGRLRRPPPPPAPHITARAIAPRRAGQRCGTTATPSATPPSATLQRLAGEVANVLVGVLREREQARLHLALHKPRREPRDEGLKRLRGVEPDVGHCAARRARGCRARGASREARQRDGRPRIPDRWLWRSPAPRLSRLAIVTLTEHPLCTTCTPLCTPCTLAVNGRAP